MPCKWVLGIRAAFPHNESGAIWAQMGWKIWTGWTPWKSSCSEMHLPWEQWTRSYAVDGLDLDRWVAGSNAVPPTKKPPEGASHCRSDPISMTGSVLGVGLVHPGDCILYWAVNMEREGTSCPTPNIESGVIFCRYVFPFADGSFCSWFWLWSGSLLELVIAEAHTKKEVH
jgi:hypothetical protein